MHVFVGGRRVERAVGDVGVERVERVDHARQFFGGEIAGLRQRTSVSTRSRDVVGGELPVEVGGSAQLDQFGRGAVGEPTAPQGSGFTGTV
jgi:hypothetical protein